MIQAASQPRSQALSRLLGGRGERAWERGWRRAGSGRDPARRPLAFSIVPTDREPETGYERRERGERWKDPKVEVESLCTSFVPSSNLTFAYSHLF